MPPRLPREPLPQDLHLQLELLLGHDGVEGVGLGRGLGRRVGLPLVIRLWCCRTGQGGEREDIEASHIAVLPLASIRVDGGHAPEPVAGGTRLESEGGRVGEGIHLQTLEAEATSNLEPIALGLGDRPPGDSNLAILRVEPDTFIHARPKILGVGRELLDLRRPGAERDALPGREADALAPAGADLGGS